MQLLPSGFQSIEAMALVAMLLFGALAGEWIVVILALILIAVVLPHRLGNSNHGSSEFSV